MGEVLFKDKEECRTDPRKCSQATKRKAWVDAGHPTIHSFWWTMTGGDVQYYTRDQLHDFPTGPIDFYFRGRENNLRMGTVIVTDFYADNMWRVPGKAEGSHMILEICKHYITSLLGNPTSLLDGYTVLSNNVMSLKPFGPGAFLEKSVVTHRAAKRLGRIGREQRALQPLAERETCIYDDDQCDPGDAKCCNVCSPDEDGEEPDGTDCCVLCLTCVEPTDNQDAPLNPDAPETYGAGCEPAASSPLGDDVQCCQLAQ